MVEIRDVDLGWGAPFVVAGWAVAVSLNRLGLRSPRLLGASVVAIWLTLLLPVGEVPLHGLIRGVMGDLSVTSLVLLAAGLFSRVTGRMLLARQGTYWIMATALVAGGLFYPFALGVGSFDPYRLGYGAEGVGMGGTLLALLLWLKGHRTAGFIIATAILAWGTGLLESSNLWDYLLDPWLVLASMLILGMGSMRPVRCRGTEREITAGP